jgi:hypothetical protein
MGIGGFLACSVFFKWKANGFGAFAEERGGAMLLTSLTLVTLGLQTIATGFFSMLLDLVRRQST